MSHPTVDMKTLACVARGYLECAAWADAPEGSAARFTNTAQAQALDECKDFIEACGPLFDEACDQIGYTPERFGHDFWLTRCGHGAGFWDRCELNTHARGPLPPFVDRNGTSFVPAGSVTTLGDLLSVLAYGDAGHISAFAYPTLEACRGWLTFMHGPRTPGKTLTGVRT